MALLSLQNVKPVVVEFAKFLCMKHRPFTKTVLSLSYYFGLDAHSRSLLVKNL